MEFLTTISPEEHDEFVCSHPLCNLLQSSNWAKIKDNWDHVIVGVKENGSLVASALVLIKRLPLSLTILYTPRGPILDYENEQLVTFFFSNFKRFAKQKHAIYLTMDPAIHCNDYAIPDANEQRTPQTQTVLNIMRTQGAAFKGFTKHIDDTIQPRYHANVYACENLRESLSKSARKALNTVEKKMVQLVPCGIEAVAEFAEVMHRTEERKQIALRGKEYFQKLMETYDDYAVIYLAKLPIKHLYEESKRKLKENEEALASCPENAKKKRFTLEEQHASLTREVNELSQELSKHGDEVVIAGAMCIQYGPTAELLYAGMDETYKRYMAPYATFYSCMEWSFQRGCTSCNMGGIEGDLQGGLTTFKANFNPMINEYIGEFEIPYHKVLYKAAMKAMAMRKKG